MTREPATSGPLSSITRAQIREVDRIAIDDFKIPGIVLMENAARSVLPSAIELIIEHHYERVLVLCGGGNNGGDGLAVARHLSNLAGARVEIGLTIDPARYAGDALVNWQIVQAMGIPVHQATPETIGSFGRALMVDAIFGTGLSKPPRDPFPAIVRLIAETGNAVLAIDLPSGLDCDIGEPLGEVAVRATTTVTLVAPKVGFALPAAGQYIGKLVVGDIGCPRAVIDRAIASRPAGG